MYSADPDQMASRSQLIWIYTVCKGRVYPGSAGLGLKGTARLVKNVSVKKKDLDKSCILMLI